MRRLFFSTMSFKITASPWLHLFAWAALLLSGPVFAAEATTASAAGKDVIVSTTPQEIEAEGTGTFGQLVVAQAVISPDSRTDSIYTITREPLHGRVGLAGGGVAMLLPRRTCWPTMNLPLYSAATPASGRKPGYGS